MQMLSRPLPPPLTQARLQGLVQEGREDEEGDGGKKVGDVELEQHRGAVQVPVVAQLAADRHPCAGECQGHEEEAEDRPAAALDLVGSPCSVRKQQAGRRAGGRAE